MLQTIIGLALLPFAIATAISLVALLFIVITGTWKFLAVLAAAFVTFVAWVSGADWWVLFLLAGLTLFLFVFAIDDGEDKTPKVA